MCGASPEQHGYCTCDNFTFANHNTLLQVQHCLLPVSGTAPVYRNTVRCPEAPTQCTLESAAKCCHCNEAHDRSLHGTCGEPDELVAVSEVHVKVGNEGMNVVIARRHQLKRNLAQHRTAWMQTLPPVILNHTFCFLQALKSIYSGATLLECRTCRLPRKRTAASKHSKEASRKHLRAP